MDDDNQENNSSFGGSYAQQEGSDFDALEMSGGDGHSDNSN